MKCAAYLAVLAAGACLALPARAQTTPTPQHPIDTRPENKNLGCSYSGSVTNGQASSTENCPATAPGANPAQQFPYPGEASPAAATSPGLSVPEQLPSAPAAGNAPTPSGAAPNPARQFPYPGETPEAPAESSSSSSSSSGSSSSSSSGNGLNDAGSSGEVPPAPGTQARRGRHRLDKVDPQSPDERESEDVSVATYYQGLGNFTAAYDRAKDAVSLDQKDADAYVALGDAARRLGKLDEAEKAYERALTLDPVPKQKKSAEKSLAEMRGGK